MNALSQAQAMTSSNAVCVHVVHLSIESIGVPVVSVSVCLTVHLHSRPLCVSHCTTQSPGCPLMGQDNNRQFRLRSGSVLNRYSSVEVGQAQLAVDSKLERS